MEHGICTLASAALRIEAAHRSEMVSQLLFGDTYAVLDTADEWVRICTDDCRYEGWLQKKQHTPIEEEDYLQLLNRPRCCVSSLVQYVQEETTSIRFPVFCGTRIPRPENGLFRLGNQQFSISSPDSLSDFGDSLAEDRVLRMLQFAKLYLNAPYLWGGRTPAGIDCSGFVQVVFSSIGIQLPRDASQQVAKGESVDFFEEARPGDVAFFENSVKSIVHTGIICEKGRIIHASGRVRIDTLDGTGIYCRETGLYTHQLRIIKRIL
jgi:gamma-D-glutamyl-L-lysine dipeptidyl-peptidase